MQRSIVGESGSFELKRIVALNAPAAVGLAVTVNVWLACGAIVADVGATVTVALTGVTTDTPLTISG
jgi:hypothetical protein